MTHLTEERSAPLWMGAVAFCGLLAVVACFVVFRPLALSEAVFAGTAREVLRGGDWAQLSFLGRPMRQAPLYTWILAAGGLARGPDWAVRLPALVGGVAIAVLAWWVVRRAVGGLAALVAGLVPLSCVGAVQGMQTAGNQTWFASALFAGWIGWYLLGVVHRRWLGAWAVSTICVLVAFFAGGVGAFLYFYFPLLWVRQPVRATDRMASWRHLLCLSGALAVCIAWVSLSWRQGDLAAWTQFVESAVGARSESYMRRLWGFPLAVVGRTMPWGLLAWPAFCQAFRPVEQDPGFCSFLRTVILAVFVPCWLLVPGMQPMGLLPLLGPFAVLTAVNYEILIRRHAATFRMIFHGVLVAVGGVAVALLVVFGLLLGGWVEVPSLPATTAPFAFGCAIAASLIAIAATKVGERRVWIMVVTVAASGLLSYRALAVPVHALLNENPRRIAESLTALVPTDVPVYVLSNAPPAAVAFYIDNPLTRVDSPDKLPEQVDRVFLLDGFEPPIDERWQWREISPEISMTKDRGSVRVKVSRGRKAPVTIERSVPFTGSAAEDVIRVRMYEGRHRSIAP